MIASWLLRTASWLLLGGWFGSWGLFAVVIAPTAFQVLPTQAAAGDLVGPVLGILHNFGIFAGVSLAALAVLRRQGWLLIALPLGLAALCAGSEYGITPAINAVQPQSFGSSQQANAADRFSMLHQASRYLFGTVELGVLGLIVLQARPTRQRET